MPPSMPTALLRGKSKAWESAEHPLATAVNSLQNWSHLEHFPWLSSCCQNACSPIKWPHHICGPAALLPAVSTPYGAHRLPHLLLLDLQLLLVNPRNWQRVICTSLPSAYYSNGEMTLWPLFSKMHNGKKREQIQPAVIENTKPFAFLPLLFHK